MTLGLFLQNLLISCHVERLINKLLSVDIRLKIIVLAITKIRFGYTDPSKMSYHCINVSVVLIPIKGVFRSRNKY